MTNFNKKLFSFHGGYLHYNGTYEGQPTYGEVYGAEKCHPSRVNMPVPLFIARFKYSGSPITKAKFVKQLCKAFTVEKYAEEVKHTAPVLVLKENDPRWYDSIMLATLKKDNPTAWENLQYLNEMLRANAS